MANLQIQPAVEPSSKLPYIGILEEQYILDFMKSTNDIKLESTLLPYDSFRCSVYNLQLNLVLNSYIYPDNMKVLFQHEEAI
jgi:hypothetical protein